MSDPLGLAEDLVDALERSSGIMPIVDSPSFVPGSELAAFFYEGR